MWRSFVRIRPGWLFISFILLVPCLGTYTYQKYRPSIERKESNEGLVVYMKENGMDMAVDEEEYLLGVLGAVLSQDSSEETTKAMVVVLRTYLYFMAENYGINALSAGEDSMIPTAGGGEKPLHSQLLGQSWLSADERIQKGLDEAVLKKAIKETKDYILTYNNVPILPLYYEVSNGKTRNFSDVWSGEAPYMTSVESVWDKSHSEYVKKIQILKRQWADAWGENAVTGGQWENLNIQIVEKDDAGYVNQIQIGADVYSGEELRCRLGLPSACFDYKIKKNTIEFICYGKGHGVGLSLFGAEAMAKEGNSWQEILQWYYPGAEII